MFEHLKKHKCVVVTGPQRSGTHICAEMISRDLKYEYVHEHMCGDNFKKPYETIMYYRSLIKDKNHTYNTIYDGVVFQLPAFSAYCHLLPDDIAIVFMRRDIEDILRSEKRIQWPMAGHELDKYFRTNGVISQIKYEVWEAWQRDTIKHYYEIKYDTLKEHPLWKKPDDREYTVLK